jgi:hypothetical protein
MKKFVDVKSGDRVRQKFFVLRCWLALSGAVKMSNAQRHLLRLLQITLAQYRHEQAMLLKSVPSASDHWFKTYGKHDSGFL